MLLGLMDGDRCKSTTKIIHKQYKSCVKKTFALPTREKKKGERDALVIRYLRVASGPGISGNLEKSGDFVPLEKCQGKVKKFREIQKSQGILTKIGKSQGILLV